MLTILDKNFGKEFFIRNVIKNIKSFFLKETQISNPEEQIWTAIKQSSDKDAASRRADYHLRGRNVLDNRMLVYFNKILQMCRRNNIAVVTIQMPVSRHYARQAGKYLTDEQLSRYILKKCRYSNSLLATLDFRSIYFNRDDFFYAEGDHLTPKGRQAFSDYLSQQIRTITQQAENQKHYLQKTPTVHQTHPIPKQVSISKIHNNLK